MSNALVLGLGASGLAMARWLTRRGFSVRVADTRHEPPQLEALRRDCPDADFRGGDFSHALLADVELIALSPGLSPAQPPVASLIKEARRRRIEVVGEIELFARELARLKIERGYAPQVLGVTGTNGKTTTTRLAGLLVERCGRRVAVAGNIAPAALDELAARLDADDLPEIWVLELSSFQLETTTSLECDAATVLNVTQDHLDWHGSMPAYVKAKERIFGRRTVRVLNRDDPVVAVMTGRRDTDVVTFGAGAPSQPGAFGLVRDGGMSWLAWAEDTRLPARRRRTSMDPEAAPEIHLNRLMPIDALRIRGRHNALNALAALALARAIGLPLAPMLHALREYEGEPHRVQLVATLAGVEYYDDSKGTNVGATVAAIEGLGDGRRLVAILGGDGKGQDFGPLAPPLARHARAAVLIGRDAPAIRAALAVGAPGVRVIEASTLPEAVERAAEAAQPGDAVILSPACASFDMFRDYRQRADVFIDAVRERAAEAGQPC